MICLVSLVLFGDTFLSVNGEYCADWGPKNSFTLGINNSYYTGSIDLAKSRIILNYPMGEKKSYEILFDGKILTILPFGEFFQTKAEAGPCLRWDNKDFHQVAFPVPSRFKKFSLQKAYPNSRFEFEETGYYGNFSINIICNKSEGDLALDLNTFSNSLMDGQEYDSNSMETYVKNGVYFEKVKSEYPMALFRYGLAFTKDGFSYFLVVISNDEGYLFNETWRKMSKVAMMNTEILAE